MDKVNIEKIYLGKQRTNKDFYHYTSTDALINIMKNKTLRFTDCEFLNDKEEYHYIEQLLEDTNLYNDKNIKTFLEENNHLLSKENSDYIVKLTKDWFEVKESSFYVLSGSINEDSLPMWNYFVKDGNYYGYAIEFNVNEIYNELKEIDGHLYYGKVIYNRDTQIQIIKNEINKVLNIGINGTKHEIEDAPFGFYTDFIQKIRLFFKNPGFEHENEYRIVLCVNNKDGFKYDFTSKNGIIKPFIEYKFKNIPVKSITISPTIEDEIGEKGISKLLAYSGIDENKIKIKKSNIKVRY